jgi:Fis family transcriptional regulator
MSIGRQKTRDPLCQCVRRSLHRYFKDMNGEEPTNLYQMVIGEIEKPLLEIVMEQSESNQTRAARYLGINRNTLRKKLKQYDIE